MTNGADSLEICANSAVRVAYNIILITRQRDFWFISLTTHARHGQYSYVRPNRPCAVGFSVGVKNVVDLRSFELDLVNNFKGRYYEHLYKYRNISCIPTHMILRPAYELKYKSIHWITYLLSMHVLWQRSAVLARNYNYRTYLRTGSPTAGPSEQWFSI